MARASSGSKSCSSSVEPLMSANNAVTVLRSPSSEASAVPPLTFIDELVEVGAWSDLLVLSNGVAHSKQNLALGGFSALQEAQRRANGEAHSTQNFARSGFSAPHFEQALRLLASITRKTRPVSARTAKAPEPAARGATSADLAPIDP